MRNTLLICHLNHITLSIIHIKCSSQYNAIVAQRTECKTFIQQLLEPKVELRMKIEEAARHRWIRRPGMRMRTHPLPGVEPRANREVGRGYI